jgi:hypothetical protein
MMSLGEEKIPSICALNSVNLPAWSILSLEIHEQILNESANY